MKGRKTVFGLNYLDKEKCNVMGGQTIILKHCSDGHTRTLTFGGNGGGGGCDDNCGENVD